MTCHFALPFPAQIQPADLLLEAVRCWRSARDRHLSVQPSLYRLLSPYECGMLAPVFDSLLNLWEAVVGRRISTGVPGHLSDDEHELLGIVDGSRQWRPFVGGTEVMVKVFDCSLCSARMMMDRVMVSHPPAIGSV